MGKMTLESIKAAYAGESQAHIRYRLFAEQAEKDGRPNVARLFRAAAEAEWIHATQHLKVLDGVGDTAANLSAARDGEDFEATEMYPAYMAIAQLQDDKRAQQSIKHALGAEASHRDLYEAAQAAVAAGGDLDDAPLQLCKLCGYIVPGEAPDKCPVCMAPKKYFVAM